MRRRTLVGVGAAAAVALVATVTGVAVSRPSHVDPEAAPTSPAAVESACGLPGSTSNDTTGGGEAQGAAAATWTTVGGWPLPISATDGPGVRSDAGPWSCYTRTPSGAVLAGYVIAIRAGGVASDWQSVVRDQTIPGTGQAVLLGSVPNHPETVTTPRGFYVAGYSDDRATVRYRLAEGGTDYGCTIDVQWSGGDWRLVVGDDGSTSSCSRDVPENLTPWGPS